MDGKTGQVDGNEYGVESVGCVMKRFQLVCDDEREIRGFAFDLNVW